MPSASRASPINGPAATLATVLTKLAIPQIYKYGCVQVLTLKKPCTMIVLSEISLEKLRILFILTMNVSLLPSTQSLSQKCRSVNTQQGKSDGEYEKIYGDEERKINCRSFGTPSGIAI